jgi:1,2-diacylglycerol 3-alpha-glucosyltransferase
MPETSTLAPQPGLAPRASSAPVAAADRQPCRVAVIWIDWYPYHVARLRGIAAAPSLEGAVAGIELVGGIGVHAGLRFREELPPELNITTLFPGSNWHQVGQWSVARRLWAHLDQLNPEVVLVPGYYTLPALAAALWARLHRRKSVLMTESTRDDHQRTGWKEAAKSMLIRALFNWAVAGGEAHRRYLRALSFPAERIARFYDVVDNDGLARSAAAARRLAEKSAPARSPYFLYVGRLAPEKNIDGLLESYLAYRAEGGSWPLVLAGDGPERPQLEARIAGSAWTREIVFAGHQDSKALPRFYAFAGAFVLPSTREPWGLVVNEAMACGLPVLVSSRCGSAEDLVAGQGTGLVFDPADSAALTASLFWMERLSPEEWGKMSARAVARVAEYSPAHFGQEIARIRES